MKTENAGAPAGGVSIGKFFHFSRRISIRALRGCMTVNGTTCCRTWTR
jgi:hypothetical protein